LSAFAEWGAPLIPYITPMRKDMAAPHGALAHEAGVLLVFSCSVTPTESSANSSYPICPGRTF